jgi:hypothetical protein
MSPKKRAPVSDEPAPPPSILDAAVPKSDVVAATVDESEAVPEMTSPGWTMYVLKQLWDDEMFDGAPNVDGLRRVTEVVYGNVVESVSEVVGAPSKTNGGVATVVHHLTIDCRDGVTRRFSGTADVHEQNTDPEFARFASATAETRAEARAFRRALRLKKVCAAEELTTVPVASVADDAKISDHQLTAITFLCQKLNINAWKYLNAGEQKYEAVGQIPHKVAQKVISHLNVLQQDKSKIKPEHVGFDPNWKP